jgi:dTDP-4-amino-4,6-dideoxygalactose transaminase
LRAFLADRGVETGIHYPVPLHLTPAYQANSAEAEELPAAEQLARTILSLPMYPEMTISQREFVISSVREFCSTSQGDTRARAA